MPDDLADKKVLSPKRDSIVAAATELFLERGFGEVSMDTIAAKADVSKRTVYSHFENKEQLFEGIMCDVCACRNVETELFTDGQTTNLPVDQFLTKFGHEFLGAMISKESIALYRAIVCQSERFPEVGRNFFEFGPEIGIRNLAGYLGCQSEAGAVSVEDPVQAAKQFLSMLAMVMLMELSVGVRDSYSADELDSQVTGTVETFMKAFGAA